MRGSDGGHLGEAGFAAPVGDVGSGREVYFELGRSVVDHVVAGGARPERLLGAHVEAAAVELVEETETGPTDPLRIR